MAGPTCIDLFCGAGGFSLGFKRAGYDITAALDVNGDALETYSHNIDNVSTVEADVTAIDPEDFAKKSEFAPGEIDVLIGGPPCKGFSTAGEMDPDDPRNSLIENYLDFVAEIDPKAVVMENVVGMVYMNDGEYAGKIKSRLQDLGYAFDDHYEVSAAAYGVPQLRTRVMFMATKDDIPTKPPASHRLPDSPEDNPDKEDPVTAEDALSDLAFLGIGESAENYHDEPRTNYQEKMRAGATRLHNHKTSNHGETVQERFSLMKPGDAMRDLPEEHQTSKHSQQRLDPKLPSPTVTTLPEDLVHYGVPRIPSVREVARLQSFPDWFEFKGPRTTGGASRKKRCPQYSQVGNAVPPLMAEAIAEHLETYLT